MKSRKSLLMISGMVVLLVTGLMLTPVMAQEDVKEKAAPAMPGMGEMMKEKPAEAAPAMGEMMKEKNSEEAPAAEPSKPGVCPKCGCSKEKLDDIIAALEKAEKAIADEDMTAAKSAIAKAKMHLKMMAVKCGKMEKGDKWEKGKCPMCKPGKPCPKCAAKMAAKKSAEKPANAVEPVAPVPPAAPMAPAEE